MINVVIDTNIFIRGTYLKTLYPNCDKVINLINSRKIKPFFAQDTIGELVYVMKNLSKSYVGDTKERIRVLKDLMETFYNANSVNTMGINHDDIADKSDTMFVKCAIKGNVDFLISDDFRSGMHELNGYKFKVMSAKDFMDWFNEEIAV
jgi:putative PIN family toxin of toxin-antitoxin system